MADTGNSATITFGTSGFTANFHSVEVGEETRPVIDTSHLGTTNYETSMPGDLRTTPEITATFEFDPNTQPPISAAAEVITLTFPVPSGSSSGATLAGTGFVTSFGGPTLENNQLMTATLTVHFDGITEPAWSDAT